MSKIIESLKINAVYRNTTKNNIINIFKKYVVISDITFENFETTIGGEYKRVFINIEKWQNTKEANEFMELIHNGRARLNYWWDIQDNTKEKKEQLQISIDDAPLPMDEEYIYDDGVKIHRYEWKDIMSIIYGGRGIENF
jgi:hypothetical protein